MKVLQIMAGAPVGGAETFFMDGLAAISETDIKQYALTRDNSQKRIDVIKECNIPYQIASFDKNLYCPTQSKIKNILKEFQPDIAHHWLGRAGSFALKGPQVNIGWYGGYYDPRYYKNCQHHVAVTKDIADHLVNKGVPADHVHVLHLYAVCEPMPAIDRATFDTPDDVPLLLSLARLHEAKALDVLIDSMLRVKDAYLWLAGDGPLEKELKAQVERLKLQDRVKFLGWRNDREALLATADICVFPSRYEPFGAVTIEAWAAGTPIVAAKSQGPKAYIAHGENGLLVETDDVDGLAQAINQLIGDAELQKQLSENGLRAYQEGFTKRTFIENVTNLYDHVLERR